MSVMFLGAQKAGSWCQPLPAFWAARLSASTAFTSCVDESTTLVRCCAGRVNLALNGKRAARLLEQVAQQQSQSTTRGVLTRRFGGRALERLQPSQSGEAAS